MVLTTYDDIFTCFLVNCKIQGKNLPKTQQGQYDAIHNACMHYQNKMEGEKLIWDDVTETLTVELEDDRLLVLAHCMKLAYLENALTDFTDIIGVYAKDIGMKDYNSQVKARQYNVVSTESKITELVTNILSFDIM